MKTTLFKSLLVVGMALAFHGYASAQIYVNVRPVAPVVVQPVRPSPAHVWIGEEWREEGGVYKYSGGRWEIPPHPGARWIPGHWAHERRGDFWIRGHWS